MQALILADDLTGAADCGVQAARRGLRTTSRAAGSPIPAACGAALREAVRMAGAERVHAPE